MSPRGVLFDLDGVLVASEALKARAHSQTVKKLGGRLDPSHYSQVMGQSHYLAAKEFSRLGGVSFDHQRYAELFKSEYRSLLEEGVELMAGADELVRALRAGGHQLAVVSSSLRWMMDSALAQTGLGAYFEASISGDDVNKEKPAPDPYLKALELLSLEPRQALVIEDTESGIASARAAGLQVIAVKHEFNGRHDLSGAAAIVDSLADTAATLELIDGMLNIGE